MNRRDRRANAATWRGRQIPDWVPPKHRATFIRGAEYGARGEMPPEYLAAAHATVAALEAWLEKYPARPRPRFRLPGDREHDLGASIADVGHRLAMNDEAHEIVELWCALKDGLGLNDYPTAVMCRVALEFCHVPYEACGFGDIGYGPRGGGGGYQ